MRTFVLWILTAAGAFASGITPFYSGSYGLNSLGAVAGVHGYGAILFEQGNDDVLLLAGNSDLSSGVIDAVNVVRGAGGHITGFGSSTQIYNAPYIDDGMVYAPNGDLLFMQYGATGIGEIKPGGSSPAKAVASPAGGGGGTLGIVPSGLPGAGNFVTASYGTGRFCVSNLTADGAGTYDVAGCTGPESVPGVLAAAWISAGSPGFSSGAVLVARTGTIYAFNVDANGLPNPDSASPFMTVSGLVTGMTVDPFTGDLLVSTTSYDQLFRIDGFAPSAAAVPEPGSLALVGAATLLLLARRKSLRAHNR